MRRYVRCFIVHANFTLLSHRHVSSLSPPFLSFVVAAGHFSPAACEALIPSVMRLVPRGAVRMWPIPPQRFETHVARRSPQEGADLGGTP